MIRKWLSPPAFEQDEKNFRAKFINGFAWSVVGLLILALIPHLFGGPQNFTFAVFTGLIIVMLLAITLLHLGYVEASGIVIIVLGWLGISLQAFTADGVKDVIVVAFLALGLLASIILNWRAGGIVVLAGIGMIWILALLQANGIFTPSSQNPLA